MSRLSPEPHAASLRCSAGQNRTLRACCAFPTLIHLVFVILIDEALLARVELFLLRIIAGDLVFFVDVKSSRDAPSSGASTPT